MRKMRWAQHALYNDEDLRGFQVILVQEPHCYRVEERTQITGIGPNWEVLQPSEQLQQRFPVRSCMWMNKSCNFVQVQVGSPDITAARLTIQDRHILLASAYIPPVNTEATGGETGTRVSEEQLQSRLQLLQRTIEDERTRFPRLELLIAGDFNRHDLLWGGDEVGLSPRQGEAQKILDFMEANDLQCLLPRGSVTWEMDGRAAATIDLVFASSRLFEERIKCTLFENEYGSDHRAIHSSF